ncbi:methylated-DNA--[protein]-cysteine S-methyltransferase [Myroides sp. JBRI-B21084]|uniref:methylated-DNA--[protein]-cysteine S-methyltransferase n=1 Tax=Myroides sp. JBRI-B21084 TaxID=3119977 RepID=UPI0026E15535|nr:methylated-DNA--[protein]-cysteine S-methyltransferase [Paenimyroides cloacae]WKW46761.1 methylated-DNA--[protein]-cysteine S-methyltransferase [Paenimyroides cloacae]
MDFLKLNPLLQNNSVSISVSTYNSPLGTVLIAATCEGICLVEFDSRIHLKKNVLKLATQLNGFFVNNENEYINQLKVELGLYFNQKLQKFTVPLVFSGTPFQQKVFQSLLAIPYGTTTTYKKQAVQLGNVKAIRAVATANGLNKIAIVVPCHRVVGSNGELVGYAGGLNKKQALLQLEGTLNQNQLVLL